MNIDELERLAKLYTDQNQIEGDRVGQAVDLSAAIDTFILDCRAGRLSPATVRWYTSLLQAFLKAFNNKPLASISTNDLRQYIVSLQQRDTRYSGAGQRPAQKGKLAQTTIIGHQTALSAFWNWATKEYDLDNPMAKVKRMKRPAGTPKAIAAADFAELFNVCGDDEAGYRNRAILAFLGDTGVRAAGLCGLRKDKLLLAEQQALVVEKGEKTRIVVYTKYTRELLTLWLEQRALDSAFVFTSLTSGDSLTPSGLDQLLRRLKKQAGVKGRVNPHSFRHAFARECLKAGMDAIRLAKLMGHDSVDTTAAYYAIFSADELAESHEHFSPLKRMLSGTTKNS